LHWKLNWRTSATTLFPLRRRQSRLRPETDRKRQWVPSLPSFLFSGLSRKKKMSLVTNQESRSEESKIKRRSMERRVVGGQRGLWKGHRILISNLCHRPPICPFLSCAVAKFSSWVIFIKLERNTHAKLSWHFRLACPGVLIVVIQEQLSFKFKIILWSSSYFFGEEGVHFLIFCFLLNLHMTENKHARQWRHLFSARLFKKSFFLSNVKSFFGLFFPFFFGEEGTHF
jgi:hypothetical protein